MKYVNDNEDSVRQAGIVCAAVVIGLAALVVGIVCTVVKAIL